MLSFWLCPTLVSLLVTSATVSIGAQNWPDVAPTHAEFRFSSGESAALAMELFGRQISRPLYKLTCHTLSFDDDKDFDYSGAFECKLLPTEEKTGYSTLLADMVGPTRDWQSRARFLVPELSGASADFPDYGRTRTFLLRGMRITLTMSNVAVSAGLNPLTLSAFRFTVDVQAEPAAQSPIAAPSSAPLPPPACGNGYRSH
jgi:hypothetical protein